MGFDGNQIKNYDWRIKSESIDNKYPNGKEIKGKYEYYEPQDKHHGFDFKVGNVRYRAKGKDMDFGDSYYIGHMRAAERNHEDKERFHKRVIKKSSQSHKQHIDESLLDMKRQRFNYEQESLINGSGYIKKGKFYSNNKRAERLYERHIKEQKKEEVIKKEVDRRLNRILPWLIWNNDDRTN